MLKALSGSSGLAAGFRFYRFSAQSAGMLKPTSKSLHYYDARRPPKASFFPDPLPSSLRAS